MRYWMVVLLFLLPLWVSADDATPQPSIPQAMPPVDEGDYNITNILLIGSATGNNNPANPGLTDSLNVVSINRDTGHIAILSIPRDLYVYVPGFNMGKINQAYFWGEMSRDDHDGIEVLKETIRYNLGLNIDHYIRINFDNFDRLIDSVGGVNLTVDCVIRDWKLISPELDKEDPDNYEMFTLPVGLHWLDGETALWYVRSRKTSSDIDRGRRQQDLLRALWRRIRERGLLEDFPTLWQQMNQLVQTDITLDVALGFLPLALETDTADLSYFMFRLNEEVQNGYTTDETQRFVLIPNREAIAALMQQVVLPPTSSQLSITLPSIAVINASGIDGLDHVAADRLELEGFRTYVIYEWSVPRDYNKIIDYTGVTKGNPVGIIQRTLRTTDEGVFFEPDPNREYDYKVFIGNSYQFTACTRPVIQPDLRDETGQDS